MSRRLRVPMFFKFLAGCLTLAFILILGGSIVLQSEIRQRGRGNYLAKHFKRYLDYQEGLGRAVASVADLIARDPALAGAMARGAASEARTADGAHDGAGAGQTQAGAGGSAAAIAADMFEAMHGAHGIKPELMVVFDRGGVPVWAPPQIPVEPDELRALRVVQWVLDDTRYYNKVLVHGGRAYQIAGVPIHAPGKGGALVGGLILGIPLERYMYEYRQQSDSRRQMQHRLVLLHKGQIVASSFDDGRGDSGGRAGASGRTDELVAALTQERWRRADDLGFQQPFIMLPDSGRWDVYGGENGIEDIEIEGFAGMNAGVIGKLYLLRSRANLEGRDARIPWAEVAIGIVLSLLVSLVFALWITRPIKRFVVQSRQMLEGETDLTQRIELSSRDETQALARNINQVFARLYELASDVQNAAFRVGASSAQISAASRQMLAGLKDQTLKIEGSTAAVTELSASIQQVAANAAETTQVAEKSNVAVTSAVERMQQIRDAVEDAADKMQELGESSKRIGNIVEVIRQISEQTSLLALNASIEAAHAGEQGRGFAVVADEVSSLARRVGQSAKDIEALIQTIKEQTAEAVSSMQVGTREVEGGTEIVTSTLTDLRNLIDVVKDTATAVQEQALVSDEIARNMDAVQRIASEVLTGSEESVIQAEQLHELAFALERSVAGFNLDGAGRRRAERGARSSARDRDGDAGRAEADRAGIDRALTGDGADDEPRRLPAGGNGGRRMTPPR